MELRRIIKLLVSLHWSHSDSYHRRGTHRTLCAVSRGQMHVSKRGFVEVLGEKVCILDWLWDHVGPPRLRSQEANSCADGGPVSGKVIRTQFLTISAWSTPGTGIQWKELSPRKHLFPIGVTLTGLDGPHQKAIKWFKVSSVMVIWPIDEPH